MKKPHLSLITDEKRIYFSSLNSVRNEMARHIRSLTSRTDESTLVNNRFCDVDVSFKRLPAVFGYQDERVVSLEKALEPIVSQIDQLPRYIKEAKRRCRYPSEHGLTHDQSAAVFIYSMESGDKSLYRLLNQALRSENREELKVWFHYLNLLDTALDQLPSQKVTVWRGVPLNVGRDFKKGQTLTWWSFSSCTSSVDVIQGFLKNNEHSTLFLIEATNGKNISEYTQYANENEILLPMGFSFRVKSDPLVQPNGSYVVHLMEIDPDEVESIRPSVSSMRITTRSSNQRRESK